MSQLYKDRSTGPVPPAVPTQFTADDATIAIPVLNNLFLLSRETTDNNLQGIQTTASPNLGDDFYVELTNRATGALSTNDASTTTIITFPLAASATVYVLTGEIVAHNTTDAAGSAYDFVAGVITDGATATLMGPPSIATKIEMAAMVDADIDVGVTGNSVIVQVTGIAAKVVSWLAQFTYKQVI